MDLELIKQLRRNLTLHFAVIAWLTAMLIATASGGYHLPAVVFVASLCGFIFVDTLGWFALRKTGSYVGMTVATVVAIGSYIYSVFVSNSEAGQLVAVAGLLIYPECILFLQRKSLRVYEQLAIFLLLEMIVAALINDNLFFGLLLTPIMLLWVSSLFLFSRYGTLVQIDSSIDEPVPIFLEVMYRRYIRPILGEPIKQHIVTAQFVVPPEVQATKFARRSLQALPIGVGALAFAAIFFYLLPRTSPGDFRAGLGVSPSVGLPTELRLGLFGRLLQNPTPVMRVSFKTDETGKTYRLSDPPYLRARVFDTYFATTAAGTRREQPVWGLAINQPFHPPLADSSGIDEFVRSGGSDLVLAEFDIRREFASVLYTITPPYAPAAKQRVGFSYDRFNMLLDPIEANNPSIGKSFVYTLGTGGFAKSEQLAITPAFLPTSWVRPMSNQLARPLGNFPQVDEYRRNLLARLRIDDSEPYKAAIAFEQHFLNSDRFTYSLDLRPPQEIEMDPIEDFIINQPQGHCQYFAAAMVALLRQNNIPSRIVVGYRPTEYNSLGNFFPVKQSDAHAWVEALFSREELRNSEHARWLNDANEFYWVRFDPTPSSTGGAVEITPQRGQAMDYAEKLWKDYVVDAQKISGENNLYAPVTGTGEQAYDGMIARLKQFLSDVEKGRYSGGRIGFAWPLAIATIVLGAMTVAIWQLIANLPRFAPNLAQRLGLVRQRKYEVKQAFYARCLALLEKRGLRRATFQTPQEFTAAVAATFDNSEAKLGPSLKYLTELYYRLRFGTDTGLSADEARGVDEALRKIESANKA